MELREVVPRVVRVLDAPASVTLPELHHLLQAAIGWTDSHLHQFVVPPLDGSAAATGARTSKSSGGDELAEEPEGAVASLRARLGEPEPVEVTTVYSQRLDDGFESDVPWWREADETGVRLRDLPERFVYAYDLGDGWEHDVAVLGRGGERVGLVSGEGNCPPEDCGGPFGYAQLLAARDFSWPAAVASARGHLRVVSPDGVEGRVGGLAGTGIDAGHDVGEGSGPAGGVEQTLIAQAREELATGDPEWVEQLRAAAGDIRPFDAVRVDQLVEAVAGAVPDSVRLLLQLCGTGVKLTAAGRLPTPLVRAVQEQRPAWAWDERPVRSEDDLIPLAVLHGLLRQVGILRLSRGRLGPIKAVTGPDGDVEIVRRLRSFWPERDFRTLLVTEALVDLVARGPRSAQDLADQALPLFESRWSGASGPVTAEDLARTLRQSSSELTGLDMIDSDRLFGSTWRAGRSAATLLPGVSALLDLAVEPAPR